MAEDKADLLFAYFYLRRMKKKRPEADVAQQFMDAMAGKDTGRRKGKK
jgi:hypothetical protein